MLEALLSRRGVLWLLFVVQVIWLDVARSEQIGGDELANETGTDDEHGGESVTEEEEEPAYAVLFPPFTLAVGVVVFYVLSRYIKALPYTAVMFLIGTLMGITSTLGNHTTQLSKTLSLWISIVSVCPFGEKASFKMSTVFNSSDP